MKTRTRTLAAISSAAVTTGLALSLAFAGNSAATGTDQTTPTTVSTPTSQMPGMGAMTIGDPTVMVAMMGSADMSAMLAMHQVRKGSINDHVLDQCDQAHAAMTAPTTITPEHGQNLHEAHHGGTGS